MDQTVIKNLAESKAVAGSIFSPSLILGQFRLQGPPPPFNCCSNYSRGLFSQKECIVLQHRYVAHKTLNFRETFLEIFCFSIVVCYLLNSREVCFRWCISGLSLRRFISQVWGQIKFRVIFLFLENKTFFHIQHAEVYIISENLLKNIRFLRNLPLFIYQIQQPVSNQNYLFLKLQMIPFCPITLWQETDVLMPAAAVILCSGLFLAFFSQHRTANFQA